ncbi:MAG: prephenate dehydratase [Thermodesulfobacteriota bacterium]|nr:prephenate dehydratase [Thermodesulfobacteriota bacterium]
MKHFASTDVVSMPPGLDDLRREITRTDRELLALLNHRARLCRQVGRVKSAADQAVFKPFREKEVLEGLVAENPGDLPDDHLRTIYREILSSSRRLQQPQKAVYLGPEGTFSYFAGRELLGSSTDFEPCASLETVFAAVAGKKADLGIVPLENSLSGSAGQNLNLFLRYGVYIQAEIYLRISYHLVGAGTGLAGIQTVYSHPRAIDQCAAWLSSHLPEAHVVFVGSTAAAAREAAGRPDCAAVGHRRLAAMFSLNLLAGPIEDAPDNWTRFIVIGHQAPAGGSRDKTSILFTLPDESGALVSVLSVLARGGINMKKLESRPMRSEKWQYLFFADLECDLSDDEYADLQAELAENCQTLRVLGSYPAGLHLNDC